MTQALEQIMNWFKEQKETFSHLMKQENLEKFDGVANLLWFCVKVGGVAVILFGGLVVFVIKCFKIQKFPWTSLTAVFGAFIGFAFWAGRHAKNHADRKLARDTLQQKKDQFKESSIREEFFKLVEIAGKNDKDLLPARIAAVSQLPRYINMPDEEFSGSDENPYREMGVRLICALLQEVCKYEEDSEGKGSVTIVDGYESLHKSLTSALSKSKKYLNNAILQKTVLRGVSFLGGNITSSQFQYCDLAHTNFEHTEITHTEFYKSQLQNAYFSQSNIYSSNFSQAQMQKSTLYDATISSCNFNKTNLENAKLSRARFEMSNIQDCNMNSSMLISTDLSEQTLEQKGFSMKYAKYSKNTKWPSEGFNITASGAILWPPSSN